MTHICQQFKLLLSHSNGPFQPYPLLKRGDLKEKRDSKKNMKNSFWSASFKPSKWPIQAFRKTTDCLFKKAEKCLVVAMLTFDFFKALLKTGTVKVNNT